MRVLKVALEKRWNADISIKRPVVPWMEYAAFLLNWLEVGHDGNTFYERLKGKRAVHHGIEFGESVHWKAGHAGGALGKTSSAWHQWRVPRSEGQVGRDRAGGRE